MTLSPFVFIQNRKLWFSDQFKIPEILLQKDSKEWAT